MFFGKYYHVIRWDDHSNQTADSKLKIVINSIKPFKRSFFGVRNAPAAFDFVPNAMEILGEVTSLEAMQLENKTILFLVPEEDLCPLKQGDIIELWLTKVGNCFKFEKVGG